MAALAGAKQVAPLLNIALAESVLVQREMERRRCPLVSNPPGSGGDFQGIRVYRSDGLFEERESVPPRSRHRFDEPARLSLGMVASLQSQLPFHVARSL
jgi:hypothetical protein